MKQKKNNQHSQSPLKVYFIYTVAVVHTPYNIIITHRAEEQMSSIESQEK